MATIVITYEMRDSFTEKEREFCCLESAKVWLSGQSEEDFDWIDMTDNKTEITVNDWDEIHQYVNENTGAHLEPKPVC
ncbi:MAG: hypothetical protein [Caudoviricetes sp.]|nr:MAG: hypothetical protein [Caudoviricetes sp.]